MSRRQFIETLDACAASGCPVEIWLRDDDATEPSAPLAMLLDQAQSHIVPVTLAVIPAPADEPLANFLSQRSGVSVAVHGWRHENHASAGQKKQELGLHRGEKCVLEELQQGIERLTSLFGETALPLLVPPWNRIDPALVEHLPSLGYAGLSVFGPERSPSSLALLNTHVDVIDWKGTRGGRAPEDLYAEAAQRIIDPARSGGSLGLLTHHLVHDDTVWRFLEDFYRLTSGHPGCRWVSAAELMKKAPRPLP